MPCCKNRRSRCRHDNNKAPQDMPVDGVQVYVAANPLYTGS